MTYVTKGEYTTTDDGYLIGYKLIKATYRSFQDNSFAYTQGKVAGHRPDELKPGFFFRNHYHGDQLHHCCTQKELEHNYGHFSDREGGARLVRLLIHPNDLIQRGVCYRAYVDLISPVMRQWGIFEPDGPLAPDLPPVTELEKKKLNAGLPVDQVISVIMEAKPEPEPIRPKLTLEPLTPLKPVRGTVNLRSFASIRFPDDPYHANRR